MTVPTPSHGDWEDFIKHQVEGSTKGPLLVQHSKYRGMPTQVLDQAHSFGLWFPQGGEVLATLAP